MMPARLVRRRWVWIGGLTLVVLIAAGLFLAATQCKGDPEVPPAGEEMRIRIVGEMWWWRVAYLGGGGESAVLDANELHIPVGQPVVLELESADVVHGFRVPGLTDTLDMVPGRRNVVRVRAERPGVHAAHCAEYCGGPHPLMGFMVVAHAPEEFAEWLAARRAPADPPFDPLARRGAEIFAGSGCGACHRVRGTSADGRIGPDLSHVGARRSLGAGILPNNRGTLAGWVADSQTIKPGNGMPSYDRLSGAELQALAAYLEGLE